MRALDVLIGTLQSIRAHALRFALTSLGIVWGITMLTFVVASMDGFEQHWDKLTTKIGSRLIFLIPGTVTKPGTGDRVARTVELELADVARVSRLRSVEAAAPAKDLGLRILRAGANTKLISTHGVSERTALIRNFEMGSGRFLSAEDVEFGKRVVVLGAVAAERLFGTGRAVGRVLHIDGLVFDVIGVSEPKGQQNINFGARDDERALIPISTAQRWFSRSDDIGIIEIRATSEAATWDAVEQLPGLLARHHDFQPDQSAALQTFNIEDVLGMIRTIGMGMRVFFTAAALITLAAGAIGVMNIMLVVVRERTREIGLRKALGATRGAIFVQFLAETLAVTLVSGALGAGLGWAGVAIQAAAVPDGADFAHVPILLPGSLAMVTATLVAIGTAAGTLPALRASRVQPAEALRAL